jgi:hypothetical protein
MDGENLEPVPGHWHSRFKFHQVVILIIIITNMLMPVQQLDLHV